MSAPLTPVYRLPKWDAPFYGGIGPAQPAYVLPGVEVVDAAGHPDSYRVAAICLNCKWSGQVREAASRTVKIYPGYHCPACKCATVHTAEVVGRDWEHGDSREALERAQEEYLENLAEYEAARAAFNRRQEARHAEREAASEPRKSWIKRWLG